MKEKKAALFMTDLLHYDPSAPHNDSETLQGFAITHNQVSSMYTDGTIDTDFGQTNEQAALDERL